MPKVFIIEPPRNNIDVSKAQEYGDIVYVFSNKDRRCSAWEHVRYGQTVLQRLKRLRFDNDVDFVCIVGTMLTVSIAVIAIAQHYSGFNVLLFNSVSDSYEQRRFDRGVYG